MHTAHAMEQDGEGASAHAFGEANIDGDEFRRDFDFRQVHVEPNVLSKPKAVPSAVSTEWLTTMGVVITLLVVCIAGILCFHCSVKLLPLLSAPLTGLTYRKVIIDDNSDEIE